MESYRELLVWQKAHALTLTIYRVTKEFPSSEKFELTSQIRRAAASIGANLAEGSGRRGSAEFHRFAQIALGSATELDYHLLLARDLGYLPTQSHTELEASLNEVRRMLTGLIQKLAR